MKQYKLGETVWKYNRTQEYTKVRKFTCEKYGYRCLEFTENQLVELGAVPTTESRQIEFEEVPEYKTITKGWGFEQELVSDNQDERIEALARNQDKIIKLITQN